MWLAAVHGTGERSHVDWEDADAGDEDLCCQSHRQTE